MTAAGKVRLLAAVALVVGVGCAAVTGWGDVAWWAPIVLCVAVVVA
jgi:hypothetical protein